MKITDKIYDHFRENNSPEIAKAKAATVVVAAVAAVTVATVAAVVAGADKIARQIPDAE